jgi:hypothetical protein
MPGIPTKPGYKFLCCACVSREFGCQIIIGVAVSDEFSQRIQAVSSVSLTHFEDIPLPRRVSITSSMESFMMTSKSLMVV